MQNGTLNFNSSEQTLLNLLQGLNIVMSQPPTYLHQSVISRFSNLTASDLYHRRGEGKKKKNKKKNQTTACRQFPLFGKFTNTRMQLETVC